MELKDLMKLEPEELAFQQADELKKHVIEVLEKVKDCILTNNFAALEKLTFWTSSGTDCINFSYTSDRPMDFIELVSIIKQKLKSCRCGNRVVLTYGRRMEGVMEEIIKRIYDEPENWITTGFDLIHNSGTEIWISNGQNYLKINISSFGKIDVPRKYKRKMWKAVKWWIDNAPMEKFRYRG